MELVVDNSPLGLAVGISALYTQANIRTVSLDPATVQFLRLSLPVLAPSARHILSILRTIGEISGSSTVMSGNDDCTKAQVSGWVEAACTIPSKALLALLEAKLLLKTFLVSNHLTFSDIVVYFSIQDAWSDLVIENRHNHPCVIRWARHLQSIIGLSTFKNSMNLPDLPPSKLPFEVASPYQVKDLGTAPQVEEKKKAPRAKKQPVAKPEERTDLDPMSYIDLRVGLVEQAWCVEGSDNLYCEKINLGTETRQVVSGLVKHVPLCDFEGSLVIVICNLKKTKLKGTLSEAMVLAGNDGDKIELIRPPGGAQPGDVVWVEGLESCPLKQLPEKKKYWEAVKAQLRVLGGAALYKGRPLLSKDGELRAPSIQTGTIS